MTEVFIPIVNIDMDGVVAGFDNRVDEIVEERFGLKKPPFRKHFYSAENFPKKYVAAVNDITKEKDFFASLPVIEGAIEGIARIISAGYHPRVLSSPIRSNPYSTTEKLGWLEEHVAPKVGSFIVSEAIITSDKHLYDGVVLIDDRPEIRSSAEATWEHVLFTQDYNRHITDQLRIDGWFDPSLEATLQASVAKKNCGLSIY